MEIKYAVNRYALLVDTAARQADKALVGCLSTLHLKPKHYAVMGVVDHQEINQGRIAEVLWLNRNVMVKLIDELETLGLAQRHVNEENRREYTIKLTDKGKTTLTEANRLVLTKCSTLFDSLSEREQQQIVVLLRKILNVKEIMP